MAREALVGLTLPSRETTNLLASARGELDEPGAPVLRVLARADEALLGEAIHPGLDVLATHSAGAGELGHREGSLLAELDEHAAPSGRVPVGSRVQLVGEATTRRGPVLRSRPEDQSMKIHYLEIVTPEAEAVVAAHERQHGVRFGEPEAALGNARTAPLPGGGKMGVRAPMHEAETPVVRPYLLVDDIEAAVASAVAAGGEVAHPPMEIPGHGRFAIYVHGGIHCGLWQV